MALRSIRKGTGKTGKRKQGGKIGAAVVRENRGGGIGGELDLKVIW